MVLLFCLQGASPWLLEIVPLQGQSLLVREALLWLQQHTLFFQGFGMLGLLGVALFFAACDDLFRWGVGALVVLTLFISVQTFGLGVKNHYKHFAVAASALRAMVGEESLVIKRAPREELFDPLLYYLGRPVTLSPAEEFSVPRGQFVVARLPWYLRFRSEQPNGVDIEEVGELTQLADRARGRGDRQLIVFRVKGD